MTERSMTTAVTPGICDEQIVEISEISLQQKEDTYEEKNKFDADIHKNDKDGTEDTPEVTHEAIKGENNDQISCGFVYDNEEKTEDTFTSSHILKSTCSRAEASTTSEPTSVPASSTDSFFCFICYSRRSTGDLVAEGEKSFQLTNCGHRYCFSCLQAYLESNILEGKTQIKCCCLADEVDNEQEKLEKIEVFADDDMIKHDTNPSVVTKKSSKVVFCDSLLSTSEIEIILASCPITLKKYIRFKFLKENPRGRECPACAHLQVHPSRSLHIEGEGDKLVVTPLVHSSVSNNQSSVLEQSFFKSPSSASLSPREQATSHPNAMVCELPECHTAFCFQHSLAHPPSVSCEDYELSIEGTAQASIDAILKTSKPCPGCGIYVSKTDGCNHMKCTNCQQCFCWVCGVAVEDALFPNHFQWWNAMGCANMQMMEDVVPSRRSIIFARVTAVAQTVLLGPISLASTLVSFLVCFPCLYSYHTHTPRDTRLATSSATKTTATPTATVTQTKALEEVKPADTSPFVESTRTNVPSSTNHNDATITTKRISFPWSQTIQGCVSGWGFFYLCVLVVLPLVILVGTGYIIYFLCYIISYPFYYYSKRKKGESLFPFFIIRRQSESSPPIGSASTNATDATALPNLTSLPLANSITKSITDTAPNNEKEARKYIAINVEEEVELRKLEEGVLGSSVRQTYPQRLPSDTDTDRPPAPDDDPDDQFDDHDNINNDDSDYDSDYDSDSDSATNDLEQGRKKGGRSHYSGRFDLSSSNSGHSLLKISGSTSFGGSASSPDPTDLCTKV